MENDGAASVSNLPDFSIPWNADLPSVPGSEPSRDASPLLARRLGALLARAEINRIPAPAQRPDGSLVDEMQRICEAAAGFSAAPGVTLQDVLWTRSAPFWNGELARSLAQYPPGEAPTGFVLMFSRDFTRRAALLGHAQPFVVEGEIAGHAGAGGPYLVLVACQLDPTGRAIPSHGFAQPIFNGHHFMPVGSPFERDVLTALVALQRRLDCEGLDCTITRPFDALNECFTDNLSLTLSRNGKELKSLTIELAEKRSRRKKSDETEGSFLLNPSSFADGSFVGWLEQSIAAPLPPASASRQSPD